MPSVGLYMIHWPGFGPQSLANDAFVEGLAKVKQAGLAQAVGVSNFREDRLRAAHRILQVDCLGLSDLLNPETLAWITTEIGHFVFVQVHATHASQIISNTLVLDHGERSGVCRIGCCLLMVKQELCPLFGHRH